MQRKLGRLAWSWSLIRVLMAVVWAIQPARGDTISFTKIADTNTPIPGGIGTFTSFNPPAVDTAGRVAFQGFGIDQEGVYSDAGGVLSAVADLNTPIPGRTGNFTTLSIVPLSMDQGVVAFHGSGRHNPEEMGNNGIYTNIGGTLSVIADVNTPVPDGTGNFLSMLYAAIDGGDYAFNGISAKGSGIYLQSGGVTIPIAQDGMTDLGGIHFRRYPPLDCRR